MDDERWLDFQEAARILETGPGQAKAMIAEELLDVSGDHGAPRFLRAEVLALRELGG